MPQLGIQDVVMDFPGVRALNGVSLDFREGEVHGIIGENGAGKSTLMKILSGIQHPTAGQVLLDGEAVRIKGVRHAQARGIAMIHQELNLVDELTVYENVFLGREHTSAGFLNRPSMIAETEKALQEVQAAFSATTPVGDLTIANKQLVEIAKAVSTQCSILIMDEPTAVLSEPESQALFALIARLKAQGVTVIYISHRLAEVCAICDRISVLRDGAYITTVEAAGASPSQLADLMVGRALNDFFPAKITPVAAPAIFEIVAPGGVHISLAPGEIVGLSGLVGAGRTELAEAAFGVRHMPGVTVRVNGESVRIRNARDAMRAGIAYVSEDRKGLGLHVSLPIQQNLTLANLRAYGALVSRGKEGESMERWRSDLDIRMADPQAPIRSLSGGNQQKVSVAKWLETQPRVLLLDEPTRGVDVGAKREMYDLIQKLASEGLACLVISSDLPEIIGLCHRTLVMREGAIVGELQGDELTEEAIIRLAAGVVAA